MLAIRWKRKQRTALPSKIREVPLSASLTAQAASLELGLLKVLIMLHSTSHRNRYPVVQGCCWPSCKVSGWRPGGFRGGSTAEWCYCTIPWLRGSAPVIICRTAKISGSVVQKLDGKSAVRWDIVDLEHMSARYGLLCDSMPKSAAITCITTTYIHRLHILNSRSPSAAY